MSHDHANDDHGRDDDLIGKIREKAGWLTGDREVEAKGKLRRLQAALGSDEEASDEDAEDVEEAEHAVEHAEQDLRRDYGEYDPDVDDRTPAPDTRPVDEQ